MQKVSQLCLIHGLEVQILNLDKQFQGNRFQCLDCVLQENQNHLKVRIDEFLQNPAKALLNKIEKGSKQYNLEQVLLDLQILQDRTNQILGEIRKGLKILQETHKQLTDGIVERLKIKQILDLKDQLFEPQLKINLDDISNNYECVCTQLYSGFIIKQNEIVNSVQKNMEDLTQIIIYHKARLGREQSLIYEKKPIKLELMDYQLPLNDLFRQ